MSQIYCTAFAKLFQTINRILQQAYIIWLSLNFKTFRLYTWICSSSFPCKNVVFTSTCSSSGSCNANILSKARIKLCFITEDNTSAKSTRGTWCILCNKPCFIPSFFNSWSSFFFLKHSFAMSSPFTFR